LCPRGQQWERDGLATAMQPTGSGGHQPTAATGRLGLEEAYAYCRRLARTHYENFTVASWLLPREMWQHTYNIYAFCRGVDDLGDEAAGGAAGPGGTGIKGGAIPLRGSPGPGGPGINADRLALLDWWEGELHRCYHGSPSHPAFIALAETVRRFNIPAEPFLKLIEANRIDQRQSRHPTFDDLLFYCEHSANPVGHLFLYLFGYTEKDYQRLSDYTCTALQLTNFWQDIAIDLGKGRIYIPTEDMDRFGYTEGDLEEGVVDERFRQLMAFQADRTRHLFQLGLRLVKLVDRRLKLDLLLFSRGGMKILERIERRGYDVFRRRPRLTRLDRAMILLHSLWDVRWPWPR